MTAGELQKACRWLMIVPENPSYGEEKNVSLNKSIFRKQVHFSNGEATKKPSKRGQNVGNFLFQSTVSNFSIFKILEIWRQIFDFNQKLRTVLQTFRIRREFLNHECFWVTEIQTALAL